MTAPPELVIVGAGGHAKVVADAVRAEGRYSIIGFVDEHSSAKEFLGRPVHGNLSAFQSVHFIVAIGNNRIRQEKFEALIARGWRGATVIHPSAVVGSGVQIGEGTVLMAGVIVNIDATIGANCIVNTAAAIDHDCVIANHVHVGPGCNLAGSVRVEEGSFLGIGTKVIPGRRIGSWCTIGAGAVVIRDIADGVTAVGVPARPLSVKNKVQAP